MIFYLNETLFPYIMENFFIYYEKSFPTNKKSLKI